MQTQNGKLFAVVVVSGNVAVVDAPAPNPNCNNAKIVTAVGNYRTWKNSPLTFELRGRPLLACPS